MRAAGIMPEQTIKAVVESSAGYLWFVFMAIWGGTASYVSRLKKTRSAFSIVELVGEWSISGFSGIVTAYICTSLKLDFYITAAAAGIAGHMGGRGIYLIELYFQKRGKAFMGNSENSNDKSE